MKCTLVIAVLVLTALFSPAGADVPELLSYQGVLTDAAGTALPDGDYNVTFNLYTGESGGTAIWTEPQVVTVTKGIFNVRLGSVTSLAGLTFAAQLYLGVSVEGEAELTPRTALTSAPYAMTARQVVGSAAGANAFPDVGYTGIGTTSPNYPLDVRGSGSVQVPLYVTGSDASWTSIYIRATQAGSGIGIGYVRGGLEGYSGLNSSGGYFVSFPGGSTRRFYLNPSGLACIGSGNPVEKLDVEGAIRLGTTATTNSGTIRFTGSDFEGYDGATWKSFTATGSGTLPSGSSGNTLRHNGSDWVATSNLHNDGANIGIGTSSPGTKLHVYGADAQIERIETSSNTGSAQLELKATDGAFDYLRLAKYASSAAAGSIDGIALADCGVINTGTMGGPLLIDVMTSNPMYFLTNNLERMRLDASGNLGINTKSPGAKLHVDGNQWDLTNTEGDMKIGDATYRLKFGVATGGGGAGTAGIRVAGGAQKLILGGGASEVLSIDGAGNTSIGGATSNAKLRLFRSGVDSAVAYAYTNSNGGNLLFYDEADHVTAGIQADGNGTGGYFSVANSTGLTGFLVDGNYSGTEHTMVGIYGDVSMSFNTNNTGDLSVNLPNNAVSKLEVLDEPGAASYAEGLASVALEATETTIGSQSITVPGAGYVLVLATGQLTVNHSTGTGSSFVFGVSGNAGALPANQDVGYNLPAALETGSYSLPISVHGLFQVAAAGVNTYYFLGIEYANPGIMFDVQLTLVYIPTAYGTIQPTLAGSNVSDEKATARPAIDVAAQRAVSEAANNERIMRELEALKAEVEELKAGMQNQ
jgi:hypothetical protein